MAYGEFFLGGDARTWAWGPQWGSVLVKYSSAADNNQVKADGKDDARQTFRGREVRRITLTLTWRQDKAADGGPGPIDIYVTSFLTAISPAGPTAGKPWAWIEDDQGIHNVNNVTVDKLETVRTPGMGSASATITLASWVKPVVKPAVTSTPAQPQPWSPTGTANFVKRTLPGFGTTPVKVKP